MRRPDRSINIFSLSMLDVISGALGAFLIVMVALMPYYNKEAIDYQREIQELQQEAAEAQQQAEAAEQRLSNIRFMIFSIRWSTSDHDVDLHVVDPSGAEFSYVQRTIAGRPGELTQDDQRGPGMEIWEIHEAPAGEYRFYASLFSRHGNPQHAQLQARLSYRDGVEDFPAVQLEREGDRVLLATAAVQEDGSVVIRTP